MQLNFYKSKPNEGETRKNTTETTNNSWQKANKLFIHKIRRDNKKHQRLINDHRNYKGVQQEQEIKKQTKSPQQTRETVTLQ